MLHISRYSILLVIAFFGCVFLPEQGMALQTHGEPEGIYVHQMAHIIYIAALGYLYWDTQRSAFSDRGWIYLRIFCVLTILWNILAFVGHAATQILHPEDFITTEGYLMSKVNMPITFVKIVYYAARLDHLLMVPAMFFLFLSMRSFYKHALKGENE